MAGVRRACRARQLSRNTEAAYVHWVARYQRFLGLRRSATGDEAAACRFLDHLVERGEVATSSHLQAINALLFLHREVLGAAGARLLERRRGVRRPQRLPEVLSPDEVRAALNAMRGLPRLVAALLYGSGMRVGECVALRVQDLDFRAGTIVVRSGKGAKDRMTV